MPRGDKGEPGGKDEPIAANARRAFAYLILLALAIGAASLLWTASQVSASQHRWCTTLALLTAQPVPKPAHPAADPSRQRAYVFYTDFRDLRRELGCG